MHLALKQKQVSALLTCGEVVLNQGYPSLQLYFQTPQPLSLLERLCIHTCVITRTENAIYKNKLYIKEQCCNGMRINGINNFTKLF